uniref:Uncharacterized protein n=1 Tax=Glossina brevipalpis TaxID=37001 RepID=A0A1A9W620_9MUSC
MREKKLSMKPEKATATHHQLREVEAVTVAAFAVIAFLINALVFSVCRTLPPNAFKFIFGVNVEENAALAIPTVVVALFSYKPHFLKCPEIKSKKGALELTVVEYKSVQYI